jgi:hypothetical protein
VLGGWATIGSFRPLWPRLRARAGSTLLALGSGAGPPSSPFNPEVMEIDENPVGESNEDLVVGPDPLPD